MEHLNIFKEFTTNHTNQHEQGHRYRIAIREVRDGSW